MRKRITLLVAALMMALTMSLSGVAFAKITTVVENPAGKQPPGQQDGAKGQAQEEFAENPAGKRTPGQQP